MNKHILLQHIVTKEIDTHECDYWCVLARTKGQLMDALLYKMTHDDDPPPIPNELPPCQLLEMKKRRQANKDLAIIVQP